MGGAVVAVEEEMVESEDEVVTYPLGGVVVDPEASDHATEVAEEEDNTCTVCLERPRVISIKCDARHNPVMCCFCRRVLVAAKLGERKQDLNNRQLERTPIMCPICRVEGRAVKDKTVA